MKQTRVFLATAAIAFAAGMFSACGDGSSKSEAEAAAIPTDGLLGELPKAVAEFEAAEAAAEAKYEELREKDPEEARKYWTEYIHQGNSTKFKKETLPAVSNTLKGIEIPSELAEGLPLELKGNFTLDDARNAYTSTALTVDANQQTPFMNYKPVAYDSDGNAIETGSAASNWNTIYPVKQGKELNFRFYIGVSDYDAARWAKLKKIVIMDSESEAFKQAEEQIKANKKAFKDKDKDKE